MIRVLQIIFGIVALLIGLLNTFWGNDPGYGIAVVLAALLFFPGVFEFLTKKIGIQLPKWTLILLALFILWTALGVAELFAKIALMRNDLNV